MKDYNTQPLSALNADLNTAVAAAESLNGYATKESLTAYAQLSDIQGGDYLPLSGGNLSGRIYLKQTETRIVGSTCVFTYRKEASPYFGFIEDGSQIAVVATISVENAGQEFLDMLANWEDYDESGTDYQVRASIAANEDWYSTNKSKTVTGTVSFGNFYSNGEIAINLDFPEYAEDDSNLTINTLHFIDAFGEGQGPEVYIDYTADYQDDMFDKGPIDFAGDWTIDTVTEEVTINEPFVISSELPQVSAFATREELTAYASASDLQALSTSVGDINSVLDSINGEII